MIENETQRPEFLRVFAPSRAKNPFASVSREEREAKIQDRIKRP
jgi:hypothetical protein